jgi:ADP-L-glycero-D-manno-heptose 6-epimerase
MGTISPTTANDADALIANNLNCPIALWRWCTAACQPLIYASSAATYGTGRPGSRMRAVSKPSSVFARSTSTVGQSTSSIVGDAGGKSWASIADGVGLKFLNFFGTNEISANTLRFFADRAAKKWPLRGSLRRPLG